MESSNLDPLCRAIIEAVKRKKDQDNKRIESGTKAVDTAHKVCTR